MRRVVLDIETIPCSHRLWMELEEGLQQKFLRDDKSEEEGWKSTALDPALGRIACIGLLFVRDGSEQPNLFVGSDEAGLLRRFWDAIDQEDYIIGHNVLEFDLPFVRARSVVCKVRPTRAFDLRRYSTETIYDTMQVFAHWQSRRWPSLELLAKAFALRGKLGSGREVYGWWRQKRWEEIKRYCEQDLRLTYQVYRRLRRYGLE